MKVENLPGHVMLDITGMGKTTLGYGDTLDLMITEKGKVFDKKEVTKKHE